MQVMKNRKLNYILFIVFFGLGAVAYKFYDVISIESINLEILNTPTSAGESLNFKQLDGTKFKGDKPWLGDRVIVLYEDQVLGSFENYGKAPNEIEVRQRLKRYYGEERIILDVESWSLRTEQRLDPMAETHAQWYLDVLQWAHDELPGTDLGYYGLPTNPYFPLKIPAIFMADYQQEIAYLKPVLEASDSLYPSFYIYYDEPDRLNYVWSTQLYQAKVYGKPVYPFLWHRGPGSILKNDFLPDYLIEQLCSFVRTNADGFVWWSISWEEWNGEAWYDTASECFS